MILGFFVLTVAIGYLSFVAGTIYEREFRSRQCEWEILVKCPDCLRKGAK